VLRYDVTTSPIEPRFKTLVSVIKQSRQENTPLDEVTVLELIDPIERPADVKEMAEYQVHPHSFPVCLMAFQAPSAPPPSQALGVVPSSAPSLAPQRWSNARADIRAFPSMAPSHTPPWLSEFTALVDFTSSALRESGAVGVARLGALCYGPRQTWNPRALFAST
jgi:hypothetical protein